VVDSVNELRSFYVNVEVTDPNADSEELAHEYGFNLIPEIGTDYDAIVVAVSHDEYAIKDEAYFKSIMTTDGFIYDIKGILRHSIHSTPYLSL
jgi:UDP-N-acetyl-D-galactosamine dehydrogenase